MALQLAGAMLTFGWCLRQRNRLAAGCEDKEEKAAGIIPGKIQSHRANQENSHPLVAPHQANQKDSHPLVAPHQANPNSALVYFQTQDGSYYIRDTVPKIGVECRDEGIGWLCREPGNHMRRRIRDYNHDRLRRFQL